MSIRKVQQGFVGGELSPMMYGRFDDQKYQQGLAVCRNFICRPQGPVVNRPGFRFVRKVKDSSKAVRLIPFIFAVDQTMCLEFGEKYIRFHTQGQTLLDSDGDPYEIETPYLAEDLFDLDYVQSVDVITIVHPNYAPRELRRYGATDWRLQEIDFTPKVEPPVISEVTYSATSGSGAEQSRYTYKYVVTSVAEDADGIITESSASDYKTIQGNLYLENAYCEVKWSAVEGASRYRVYRSYKGIYSFIGETNETSFIDDNYEADTGITPPIYETLFAQEGGIRSVTVASQGSGYEPEGRVDKVSNILYFKINGKMGGYKFHLNVDGTTGRYNLPDYEVVDMAGENGGSGCTVKMNAYCSYGHDHADRNGSFIEGFTILTQGSGYKSPRVNLYKKGTLSKRIGIDEETGLPIIYEPTEEEKQAALLGYCNLGIASDGYDGVRLKVTDTTGSGAELRAIVQDGKVISVEVINGGRDYTSPTITAVAVRGSGATFTAEVGESGDYPGSVCYFEQRRCFAGTRERPQMIWMSKSGTDSDMGKTIPVQDDNRVKFRIASQEASRILHLIPMQKLMALTGSTEFCINSENSDAVNALNINVKAQSYIGSSQVKPCVVNNSLVFAAARGGHVYELGYNWQAGGYVTGDLSLRAVHLFENDKAVDMAFSKAPDPIIWVVTKEGELYGFTYLPDQNIGAWHRHETLHGRFESVTVVPEGNEDILYAVVNRSINGEEVRMIERMDERYWGSLENAFFVDCGSSYIGSPIKTVSGLGYLEGETVAILADGCVLPKQVVTDGKVTLPKEASIIHIGLPIVSDIQTLPTIVSLNDGSYGMGHMKNINCVWARLEQSSAFFAGPTFDKLSEIKQRTTEPYGSPPALMSREIELVVQPSWSDTGTVCIRQQEPLPLSVVSLALELAE